MDTDLGLTFRKAPMVFLWKREKGNTFFHLRDERQRRRQMGEVSVRSVGVICAVSLSANYVRRPSAPRRRSLLPKTFFLGGSANAI